MDYMVPQCDDTTQQSTVRAFDLYSVQIVQTFDIIDDCPLIYHLLSSVNPTAVNKYIVSNIRIISTFWSVKIEREVYKLEYSGKGKEEMQERRDKLLFQEKNNFEP